MYLEVEKCIVFSDNFVYSNLCGILPGEGTILMACFLSNELILLIYYPLGNRDLIWYLPTLLLSVHPGDFTGVMCWLQAQN